MTRLDLLLVALIVICAMSLINTTAKSRTLFSALEMAQQKSRQLATEWGQLQLEISARSTPNRVDEIARQQLHMVSPSEVTYLNVP